MKLFRCRHCNRIIRECEFGDDDPWGCPICHEHDGFDCESVNYSERDMTAKSEDRPYHRLKCLKCGKVLEENSGLCPKCGSGPELWTFVCDIWDCRSLAQESVVCGEEEYLFCEDHYKKLTECVGKCSGQQ